jgi:L-ascorbate metabolism protein UlaG (beta-lactamase superfamily)
MLPPVMGSLIEFENSRGEVAFRTYITGDTIFFDELKEIPRRFPDIDLALLHLGGTMFFGLLMVTMDPEQGVDVIWLVKPKTAIPSDPASLIGLSPPDRLDRRSLEEFRKNRQFSATMR